MKKYRKKFKKKYNYPDKYYELLKKELIEIIDNKMILQEWLGKSGRGYWKHLTSWIFIFSSNTSSLIDILNMVSFLKPNIIIHLSDEWGNKNDYQFPSISHQEFSMI